MHPSSLSGSPLTDLCLSCPPTCLCSGCFLFNWNIPFSPFCVSKFCPFLKALLRSHFFLTLNEHSPYWSRSFLSSHCSMAISIVLCVGLPLPPYLPEGRWSVSSFFVGPVLKVRCIVGNTLNTSFTVLDVSWGSWVYPIISI